MNVKKVFTVVTGWGILSILDWLFDNILYPAMLLWLGNLWGLIVMTVLSAIICYGYLIVYIKSDADWLGVDVYQSVKEHGEKWTKKTLSKTGWKWFFAKIIFFIPIQVFRLVIWALNKNDFLAFIALSIYEDAFKTTAFLKQGNKKQLSKKDLVVFTFSIVVSNLYWAVRWTVIIEIFKKIF